MNQEQIIKDNILLAKFTDFKWNSKKTILTNRIDNNSCLSFKLRKPEELEFNSNWSWLMEVVKKMNSTKMWDSFDISDLSVYLVSADIEATFDLCVTFVKEYNTIKNEL